MPWKATDIAHDLVRNVVREGDVAVDATAGNGHDTLFLAELVGDSGRVYGIDIQQEAVDSAKKHVAEADYSDRVEWIWAGHEKLLTLLPGDVSGRVAAVMFNLGYLPGSDNKSYTTQPDTTLRALSAAVETIKPGGVVSIVSYTGHPGGREEADAVQAWAAALDQKQFDSVEYRSLNQANNPPHLTIVSRKAL